MERSKPVPQELYRHFKGRLYQIITTAYHSETGEEMVVYQALYGSFKVYVRPLEMFMSKVDKVKYPNIPQEWRFEKMTKKTIDGFKDSSGDKMVLGKEEQSTVVPEMSAPVNAAITGSSENETSRQQTGQEKDQESTLKLPPLLLEFLDTRRASDRLKILSQMHRSITNEMVDTMAVALDVEVKPGDLEDRYNELKYCLQMREKYEKNRYGL